MVGLCAADVFYDSSRNSTVVEQKNRNIYIYVLQYIICIEKFYLLQQKTGEKEVSKMNARMNENIGRVCITRTEYKLLGALFKRTGDSVVEVGVDSTRFLNLFELLNRTGEEGEHV